MDSPTCGHVNPRTRMVCTREPEHVDRGPHDEHHQTRRDGKVIARWPQDGQKPRIVI